jgi:hypothetical protein
LTLTKDPDRPTTWSIWSEKLRPGLCVTLKDEQNTVSDLWGCNGLIALDHGSIHKKKGRCRSSLGIGAKVYHEPTGCLIKHEDYLKVYNTLRRRITKHLVYTSIHVFPDGTEVEDNREKMTEGAVRAYEAGFRFMNRPGRYVGKRR